jgi:hypothetical protein
LAAGTYEKPEFAWMQDCYAFAKVMMFDREWVNPKSGQFKVESWIDSFCKEFGGLDALALWQAYPRIGIDQRNQFDHYRDLADGPQQLKEVIRRIHSKGVKVVLAYNPWDTGTRREGKPDEEVLRDMVADFDFDGIFLDTLPSGGGELRKSMDLAKPGVVLESELALPAEAIPDHHASWGQWFNDSEAPGILRNRWLEQRHMIHMIRRWDIDHSGEMHMAWMNGAGMFIWQNIFGSWNCWNERDKAIFRSMRPIQKRYSSLFNHGSWMPLVETSGDPGIYASRWEHDGVQLWTVINRQNKPGKGFIQSISHDGAIHLFDLVRGVPLDHGEVEIPARGIGCILAISRSSIDPGIEAFLKSQAEIWKGFQPNPIRIDPMPIADPLPRGASKANPRMKVVKAGEYSIISRFRVRECGEYNYAGFISAAYPGLHSHRFVRRHFTSKGFAIMPVEVSNQEFAAFIKATGYKPREDANFLKHWHGGRPMEKDLAEPVVYVDFGDASAYATWAGLRLPTEDEWQLGVQTHNLQTGSVWNWTDSLHSDGHTEFSILKGGSEWQAKGSDWYFDGGKELPDWSAKYLHFWPGMDRSASIGFRCVADL